jgi:integrase
LSDTRSGLDQSSLTEAIEVIASSSPRIYLVTDGLRSKHTKVNYYYAFKQFLRDGAKTEDLQVLLDYKPKVIEQMIIGYVEMLGDKGKAHQTIKLHCAAIFHFFRMNDITLNQRKITRFVPPNESTHSDKAYTLGQIIQIWEASSSDQRTSVIVLLMASTGMRIGAIPVLKVEHLTPIDEHNLYQIDVYATSKHERYPTYCTPECRNAIDAYLDYRRRFGENINDNSYLIREVFDSNNPFIINAPKEPTEKMVYDSLEQALKRSGVNQRIAGLGKGIRRGIMRSHGFRKFYNTMMIKAKVDFNTRHALVGHKSIRGLDINYDRTPDIDRLEEYLRAIPFLTIDPNQRIEQENQDLKTVQAERIARLQAQVDHQDKEMITLVEYVEKRYIDSEKQRIKGMDDVRKELESLKKVYEEEGSI